MMPRYFINFQKGNQLAKDNEGLEVPSLEAAWKAALRSAREIIANDIKGEAENTLRAVVITGENGQELLTIPANDILPEALK
jgi:uncharacterized protein DUF6894